MSQNKSLALIATISVVSGCSTLVPLQITKNETCSAPATTDTSMGITESLAASILVSSSLTSVPRARALLTSLQTDNERINSGANDSAARVSSLSDSLTPTWRSLGLVRIDPSVIALRATIQSTGLSEESQKNAADAQSQLESLLSDLPAAASAQLSGSTAGATKLGSVNRSHATLVGQITRTLGAGGYDTLSALLFDDMVRTSIDPATRSLRSSTELAASASFQAAQQEFNTAQFIEKYFLAYFRNGHFLQISLDSGAILQTATSDLQSKLSGLNLSSTDQQTVTQAVQKLATDVETKLCQGNQSSTPTTTCLLTQPLGTTAFVTRYGTSIQFSGETVTFGDNGKLTPTLSTISTTELGPQLSEVLWEAIFDSIPPKVPATSNSTACVDGLYTGDLCLSNSTTSALKSTIDTVDSDAASAQSTVTAAAGYLVRLGFWAALNNEAVAKTVETSAGEVARKVTEKLVWINENATSCASKSLVHPIVSTPKDY